MNTENFETQNNTNNSNKNNTSKIGFKPTPAYIGAAWVALGAGLISYCIGLYNADMLLNEKGYYFSIILFGLFSAISVQKCSA